jgi:hypothetical protein
MPFGDPLRLGLLLDAEHRTGGPVTCYGLLGCAVRCW